MIVIEMYMHPGQNVALPTMLNMGQLSGEITHMMVVDERDGPDSFFVLVPFLTDEVVAYEITQRFRSIGILSPFYMMIKGVQQMLVERNSEPNELVHIGFPVLRFLKK